MEKEQEKQRGAKKKDGVNLGASISSDTNSCKIYKIKKGFPLFTVKNFNHQNVYVMDTPGLNSNKDAFSIILRIHELVSKEQLEIIGIGFLMTFSSHR